MPCEKSGPGVGILRICVILLGLLLASTAVFPQGKKAPSKTKKPPAASAQAASPEKPKTPAGKVSGILQEFLVQAELRQNGKNPPEKVVRLSESEVNAYLQQAIEKKSRYGVTAVQIKLLGRDYVGLTTMIDFDKVQVDDPSLAVRMVRSLLSGEQRVYVEGVLSSSNGEGEFKLEKAYFGSVRLPVYFIEKVIHFLGQRQNPPVDTSKPAQLPYGLRKVEISAGSVVLRG
ncbi:MAG: hypothetical protein HYX74_11280 [Acidobacteria bacterium]|nr:hypothetical protein [Acidobacteriota bacterium]